MSLILPLDIADKRTTFYWYFSTMDAFINAINPVKAVYHAILSSLLGQFVEDFTRQDFDVSIMSGEFAAVPCESTMHQLAMTSDITRRNLILFLQ